MLSATATFAADNDALNETSDDITVEETILSVSDASVSNQDTGVLSTSDNVVLRETDDNIVTQDNFFDYFDYDGTINHGITYDELIFDGDFSDIDLNFITIDIPIRLTGNDAVFDGVTFVINSNNVAVDGFTVTQTEDIYAFTMFGVSDVTLSNNVISFYALEGFDSYAVYSNAVNNLNLINNTIWYWGNTDGTVINNAVCIEGDDDEYGPTPSTNIVVSGNIFYLNMPSVNADTNWDTSESTVYSEGIDLYYCEGIRFVNNSVDLKYNDYANSNDDSLYAINVRNNPFKQIQSKDVLIANNTIQIDGHSEAYGISVAADGFEVSGNNVTVTSEIAAGYGIDIHSLSLNGTVYDNKIDVSSPFSYGIRSDGSWEALMVIYSNNTITVDGYLACGMELLETYPSAINNTIVATGTYTYGIAAIIMEGYEITGKGEIMGNNIAIFGSNDGNDSTHNDILSQNSMGILVEGNCSIANNTINSTNIGIKLAEEGKISVYNNTITVEANNDDIDNPAILANLSKGSVTITENFALTNGEYAVNVTDSSGTIYNNYLMASDLFGDYSVYSTGNATVYNNTPKKAFLAASDVTVTYGENLSLVSNAVDENGDPITGILLFAVIGSNEYNATTDENGQGIFELGEFEAGIYTATIGFAGNDEYGPAENKTITCTVKYRTEINLENETMYLKVNDEVPVGATLTPADAGNLTYTSSNESIVTVKNGVIKAVGEGTANVTVSFAGDDTHAAAENKTVAVSVTKKPTELDVSVNYPHEYDPMRNFLIIGHVIYNGTQEKVKKGSVDIYLNDEFKLSINIDNESSFRCDLGPLDADTYELWAKYYDDTGEFYESEWIKNYTINQAHTTINISESSIELIIGEGVSIDAVLNPSEAGDLSYSSNDTSVAQVNYLGWVDSVGAGTATITVSFEGDRNYAAAKSKTVTVTVKDKIPTELNLNMEVPWTYDPESSCYIIGNVTDKVSGDIIKKGTVDIYLNDEFVQTFYVDENTGSIICDLRVLDAGNYTVKAVYQDIFTCEYNDSEWNSSFEIRQANTEITINNATIELIIGESANIGAELIPSEAGNLIYSSNDTAVANVSLSGDVTAVGAGTALITVSFGGNENYAAAENQTVTVNVSKIPTEIKITQHSIQAYVGGKGQITAAELIPSEAGNLTYSSNDSSVVYVTSAGNFTTYSAGTALITVSFAGNDVYAAAESKTITFTVKKWPTNIALENDTFDLKVNDVVPSGAALDPSSAGELNYTSSNESIVIVNNGNITAVGAGQTTVTVSFAGTDYYEAAENKTITVTVSLNDACVSVNNSTLDLFVDDTFTIVATTDPAGLNVTYVVDNSGVVSVDDNGVVTALKEGTGNILVKVIGNGVYTENSTAVTVTVSKVPTEISVVNDTLSLKVNDVVSAGATLTPADAGNLTYVSSDETVVKVENGNIVAVAVGSANVTVSFAGDNKYAVAEDKIIAVTVDLIDTGVSVDADELDLTVGENGTVGVTTTPEGLNVTFTSSDETVATVDANGVVTAHKPGNAIITAIVGDNVTYAVNSSSVNVIVSKATPEIVVTANAITYGETLIVDVAVTGDISRRVNVAIGNESKPVSIKDGVGSVKFTGLAAATYTAIASYNGDELYSKASANTTVKVAKATPTIKTSAQTIEYGDDLVVEVTLPSDVTLRAIVTIGNETKYASLNDGVGSVKFSGLTAGVHTIVVSYNGDSNYLNASVEKSVRVNRATADIKIKADAVSYGDDLVVEVTLPSDVTRRAVVTIGNETKYVSLNDGVGSVKFSGLSAGVHTIVVSYNGDSNYLKSSSEKTVRVNRATADIKIKANAVSYGEDVVVDIKLPSDVTGPAKVIIDENTTNVVSLQEGVGSVKFSGLDIGVHSIEVTYDGDANYIKSAANKTVRVNRAVTDMKVTAENITEGDPLIVDVQLPADVSRRVEITLGNETKVVSLKNGTGSTEFIGLAVGSYDLIVEYKGDTIYKPASYSTSVRVDSK